MPLQQLVEYFNDRLELEYHNGFRPFFQQDRAIKGLFGPIAIGSQLAPIRAASNSETIAGFHAQLSIRTRPNGDLGNHQLENWLNFTPEQTNTGSDSIINFDRLTRTVHMLNYLPHAHLQGVLLLDVDPRHILGVKQDHGAYFEEIIHKCGLQTSNVVIALTTTPAFARFYPSLLKGLQNYQQRGYQIALKFDAQALEKTASDLITRAAPDFVSLSAEQLSDSRDQRIAEKVQNLVRLTASIDGRSLLHGINDKHSAALAKQAGFDLVEGDFYEQLITSVSGNGIEQDYQHRPASRYAMIAM